jgi:hypothetical protein
VADGEGAGAKEGGVEHEGRHHDRSGQVGDVVARNPARRSGRGEHDRSFGHRCVERQAASLSHRNAVSISTEEMSGSQSLISPDGRWWWDGHQWVPMHHRAAEPDEPGSDAAVPHTIIPIQRSVPMKYSREMEPPEIRARFGTILGLMGFVLTLPAAGVGTVFSMAVATGQDPPWPTIGEGILIFAAVLGFFGSWPLIGFLVAFGIRDGLRWVFLCLVCSGAVPALFLGGLLIVGAPQANASDLVTIEVALSWLWALPALGLWLLRATHTGRPLPPAKTFLSMFGSGWKRKLPGLQTQWGDVRPGVVRHPLRVPGADFALPPESMEAVYAAGGRARVTYDLQQGRIETIEVGSGGGA